ncbi:MAG: DUF5615 family PIN-like protein [Acidobacteriaceae bacterium]|nr:DUF5615 family PIN-like protein [Acidobacteriaceae bacterium]
MYLHEFGLQRLVDEQILLKARAENRIVMTFDLGFGDPLAGSGGGHKPTVILSGCELSGRQPRRRDS